MSTRRGCLPRSNGPEHAQRCASATAAESEGLRAYPIMVAASGAEHENNGWATEFDSLVCARLLDAELGATPASARTAAWRTLGRLEKRGLIHRARRGRGARTIAVTLLREDGSGSSYTRPDGREVSDRFLRIPTTFWKRGFDARITLPGLAMLLVIAKEKPWSAFPPDRMDEWYGWSGDTTQRGLKNLLELGLVERRESYKSTPLSPTGATLIYQYHLTRWMRPKAGTRPSESRGAQ